MCLGLGSGLVIGLGLGLGLGVAPASTCSNRPISPVPTDQNVHSSPMNPPSSIHHPSSFSSFHLPHPLPQEIPPNPTLPQSAVQARKQKPQSKRKTPAGLPKLCSAQDFLSDLEKVEQAASSQPHPLDYHTCVDVDSCWDQVRKVRSDLQSLRFARREASSSTRERFRESAYAIRDLIQIATGYLFNYKDMRPIGKKYHASLRFVCAQDSGQTAEELNGRTSSDEPTELPALQADHRPSNKRSKRASSSSPPTRNTPHGTNPSQTAKPSSSSTSQENGSKLNSTTLSSDRRPTAMSRYPCRGRLAICFLLQDPARTDEPSRALVKITHKCSHEAYNPSHTSQTHHIPSDLLPGLAFLKTLETTSSSELAKMVKIQPPPPPTSLPSSSSPPRSNSPTADTLGPPNLTLTRLPPTAHHSIPIEHHPQFTPPPLRHPPPATQPSQLDPPSDPRMSSPFALFNHPFPQDQSLTKPYSLPLSSPCPRLWEEVLSAAETTVRECRLASASRSDEVGMDVLGRLKKVLEVVRGGEEDGGKRRKAGQPVDQSSLVVQNSPGGRPPVFEGSFVNSHQTMMVPNRFGTSIRPSPSLLPPQQLWSQ